MALLPRQLAVLRFAGEMGIKGRATRRQFRDRLVGNLRDALQSREIAASLEVSHDRVWVELPEHSEVEKSGEATAEELLTRLFGTRSVSWVQRYPLGSLADVVETGVSLFRDRVAGKRFAVRCRWVGGRPPDGLRSHDVQVELGAALFPFAAGVNLKNPEFCVRLELAADSMCFFSEQLPGPGGLPLGVEGSAVALLSGGFDRTPPRPRRIGEVRELDGFRLERVIFESRPSFFVTANIWAPRGAGPHPGILFSCGHWEAGKANEVYQRTCALLARNGFVVLAYDPIGQGERKQILDGERKARFRATAEHLIDGVAPVGHGGRHGVDPIRVVWRPHRRSR